MPADDALGEIRRRVLFDQLLETRLTMLDDVDRLDVAAPLRAELIENIGLRAEYLESEAELVALWPRERWTTLDGHELSADLLVYLERIREFVLDPVAAPLLSMANQVVAALLRGLAGEAES